MKSRKTKKPSIRKPSIRKHLPLFVRVHYDVARNFSPLKLFGVGVMALVAVFGVLLVTQAIGPGSAAQTTDEVTVVHANQGVTVTKNSESATQVFFNVDVAKGNLTDITPVKYYTTNLVSHRCSTSDSDYTRTARAGAGTNNDVGGSHTASITDSVKVVCLRVKTFRTERFSRSVRSVVYHGYYAIAVNRAATTTTRTTPAVSIRSLRQSSTNPFRIRGYSDFEARWDAKIIATSEDCDGGTNFVRHPNTVATYSTSYIYDILNTEYQRDFHDGKQFCVRATARNGSIDYGDIEIDLAVPTAPVSAPVITVQTPSIATIPGATESSIYVTASANQDITSWRYIVVDDSVSNNYNNIGTTNPCERLFGLNPTRQDQEWLARGAWTSSLTNNPNANGLVGNFGGNADEVAMLLNISHSGRFVCIKATNTNGSDYGGRLLPTASSTAPKTVLTTQPTTPAQPSCPAGQEGGHTHGSYFANGECHSHPQDKPCGETVWQHTGGSSHNTFVVTATPPCLTAVSEEPDQPTVVSDTGVFGDESSASQLTGYVLIAAAVLGTARILVIKKYSQVG